MMVHHEQRPWISHDRDVKTRFRITVPAVAVLAAPSQQSHAADQETPRKITLDLLEIGAGKYRIEFAERLFWNKILARLLDIAVITAEPTAYRQVVFLSIPSIPAAVSAAGRRIPPPGCHP